MARALSSLSSSPSAAWKLAMDLYYEDKVAGALDAVGGNSAAYAGQALREYRLIEGEARTRIDSQRKALAPWLEFEWVPDELPHHEIVGHVILEAAERVKNRMAWDGHEKVLATVLVAEADADWHDARYGYFVDKVPYDKICLPRASCDNPRELMAVTSHEFAHVVVLNTAMGRAPHWLDEGIACLMEGRDVYRSAHLVHERGGWRSLTQMYGAFDPDRRDGANMAGIGAAYAQATILAGYLHSLEGDAGIARLLGSFEDRPTWAEIVKRIAGQDPTEAALHHSFGLGRAELFDRARRWVGL